MATYIVTSDRLIWARGTVLDAAELVDVNIDGLIDAGHISTHSVKKPAKTKTNETEE
jgi:hypothetical protein